LQPKTASKSLLTKKALDGILLRQQRPLMNGGFLLAMNASECAARTAEAFLLRLVENKRACAAGRIDEPCSPCSHGSILQTTPDFSNKAVQRDNLAQSGTSR